MTYNWAQDARAVEGAPMGPAGPGGAPALYLGRSGAVSSMVQWQVRELAHRCKACGGLVHGRRRRPLVWRVLGVRALRLAARYLKFVDPMTVIECKNCGAKVGRIYGAA